MATRRVTLRLSTLLGIHLQDLTAFLTRGEEYIKTAVKRHEIQELLGLKPSPLVGEALQALADAKFDGLITTREDAVAFLRRWAAHSAGPYREE